MDEFITNWYITSRSQLRGGGPLALRASHGWSAITLFNFLYVASLSNNPATASTASNAVLDIYQNVKNENGNSAGETFVESLQAAYDINPSDKNLPGQSIERIIDAAGQNAASYINHEYDELTKRLFNPELKPHVFKIRNWERIMERQTKLVQRPKARAGTTYTAAPSATPAPSSFARPTASPKLKPFTSKPAPSPSPASSYSPSATPTPSKPAKPSASATVSARPTPKSTLSKPEQYFIEQFNPAKQTFVLEHLDIYKQVAQGRHWYDVLGVNKNADKKTVTAAYRQLSNMFHPDKHRGDDSFNDFLNLVMIRINSSRSMIDTDVVRVDLPRRAEAEENRSKVHTEMPSRPKENEPQKESAKPKPEFKSHRRQEEGTRQQREEEGRSQNKPEGNWFKWASGLIAALATVSLVSQTVSKKPTKPRNSLLLLLLVLCVSPCVTKHLKQKAKYLLSHRISAKNLSLIESLKYATLKATHTELPTDPETFRAELEVWKISATDLQTLFQIEDEDAFKSVQN